MRYAILALILLATPFIADHDYTITIPVVGVQPVAQPLYYDMPQPRLMWPYQAREVPYRIYYDIPIPRPIAEPVYVWPDPIGAYR